MPPLRSRPGALGIRPSSVRPSSVAADAGPSRDWLRTALAAEGAQPAALQKSESIILYVHGIGPHPEGKIVKKWYDTALFERSLGDRSRLAYWADILHPLSDGRMARRIAAVSEVDFLPDQETESEDFPERSEWPKEVQQRFPSEDSARATWETLKRKIESTARMEERTQQAIRTQGVSEKILPAVPGRNLLTRMFAAMFFRDVHAYWFDADVRQRIQGRLRALLATNDRPYVLVSHSLGTVIAYDVLNQLADEAAARKDAGLYVPLWITLGSPLGVSEVQEFIYRTKDKRLRYPPQVETWHNYADPFDPIALDATLADEFSPAKTPTRSGRAPQPIQDSPDKYRNLDALKISGFNPHSSIGYLRTEQVRTSISKVVGPEFAASTWNFIIARDVSAEMTGSSERMPVLIELHLSRSGAGLTREDAGAHLGSELERIVRAVSADSGLTPDDELREARIDVLERYVAAKLTSAEIVVLRSLHRDLQVHRVWKDSRKAALINVSAERIQTYTGRVGYKARGEQIGWAVLDTGANLLHPHFNGSNTPGGRNDDFPAVIAKAWDCTDLGRPQELDPQFKDANGHGTHVAGIIAGSEEFTKGYRRPENRAPYVGMAPYTQLHIFRVLDDAGGGHDSSIIKALDHIRRTNDQAGRLVIHGVNLSLGGAFDAEVYGCGHSPICDELRRLWRDGVIVCIAAGNEGSLTVETREAGEQRLSLDLSIGDPANLEEAIAVGSISRNHPHLYGVSYFSSRGPTADGRPKPDVVAPGERIMSCNSRFDSSRAETWYRPESGTSMACPHVSGLLAGFLSVRLEFVGRPDEVKAILRKHCTDLGRDRYHQGAGMPNLVQMLAGT